ncbi:MAG: hypothetical protein HQK54_14630, partial [Oligoflexales bacterium]|nr:hypothetical protein [Oligoflexales bacterium]
MATMSSQEIENKYALKSNLDKFDLLDLNHQLKTWQFLNYQQKIYALDTGMVMPSPGLMYMIAENTDLDEIDICSCVPQSIYEKYETFQIAVEHGNERICSYLLSRYLLDPLICINHIIGIMSIENDLCQSIIRTHLEKILSHPSCTDELRMKFFEQFPGYEYNIITTARRSENRWMLIEKYKERYATFEGIITETFFKNYKYHFSYAMCVPLPEIMEMLFSDDSERVRPISLALMVIHRIEGMYSIKRLSHHLWSKSGPRLVSSLHSLILEGDDISYLAVLSEIVRAIGNIEEEQLIKIIENAACDYKIVQRLNRLMLTISFNDAKKELIFFVSDILKALQKEPNLKLKLFFDYINGGKCKIDQFLEIYKKLGLLEVLKSTNQLKKINTWNDLYDAITRTSLIYSDKHHSLRAGRKDLKFLAGLKKFEYEDEQYTVQIIRNTKKLLSCSLHLKNCLTQEHYLFRYGRDTYFNKKFFIAVLEGRKNKKIMAVLQY